MNISIVLPEHNPEKELLNKVIKAVKNQKYNGKKEIIEVNLGLGLAASLNYGIKKAKYDIIVSLHQDCIPFGKDWLKKLVEPLKNTNIIATCSDVYDVENKKRYTPFLDEKGCAYKKIALEKVGYFDDKTFLNSGEDFDMYMKLKKIGRIVHPHTLVLHNHKGYLLKKSEHKKKQNANTYGCLFRIYGFSIPQLWKALALANIFNISYFYWFWRGFLKGKQDYK